MKNYNPMMVRKRSHIFQVVIINRRNEIIWRSVPAGADRFMSLLQLTENFNATSSKQPSPYRYGLCRIREFDYGVTAGQLARETMLALCTSPLKL